MKRLLALTENVAAFFLLAIAVLTAGNVLLREFGLSIPDWFDGSKLLQGIAIFWGIAIATWRGAHIGVDIVWEHLGARARRWLDVFATLVTTAFLVPLAWMVWVKVVNTGTQTTNDLRLPIVWFYAVAAAGASVAALLGAVRSIGLIAGRVPGADRPDGAVE